MPGHFQNQLKFFALKLSQSFKSPHISLIINAMMPKSTHPRNWSSYENPLDSMQNKIFLAAAIGITAWPRRSIAMAGNFLRTRSSARLLDTSNINSASKHLVCRLFRGDE